MNPDILKQALDAIESGDPQKIADALKAVLAGASSGESSPTPDDALSGTPEPPKPEEQAAMAALMSITGKSTAGAAIESLRSRLARLDELDAQSAALEESERRGLVGDLVKLGAEVPATAWADPDKQKVCKRLADEPIADLRDRVSKLKAAPRATAPDIRPPVVTEDSDGLTPDEAKLAAKMTPAQKADYIQVRKNRRGAK